jgi:hypothetical protein
VFRPGARAEAAFLREDGGVSMTHIELTGEEQRLLTQLLERRVRELEMEILHTDNADFKAMLREQLNEYRKLLGRLSNPVALAA